MACQNRRQQVFFALGCEGRLPVEAIHDHARRSFRHRRVHHPLTAAYTVDWRHRLQIPPRPTHRGCLQRLLYRRNRMAKPARLMLRLGGVPARPSTSARSRRRPWNGQPGAPWVIPSVSISAITSSDISARPRAAINRICVGIRISEAALIEGDTIIAVGKIKHCLFPKSGRSQVAVHKYDRRGALVAGKENASCVAIGADGLRARIPVKIGMLMSRTPFDNCLVNCLALQ